MQLFNGILGLALFSTALGANAGTFNIEKYKMVDGDRQAYIVQYEMTEGSMDLIERVKLGVKEEKICATNQFDLMSDGTFGPGILSVGAKGASVTYQYSFVVDCK